MVEIKRMLVPTDFSPTSDMAIEYAVDMASRYGASVLLLHVLDDLTVTSTYLDAYFADLPGLRNDMRDDAMRRLSELAKRYAPENVAPTIEVAVGRPASTIVQEATARKADLIVMGTHGRSGFEHLVLGSVAEKVLRSAPCPVLTVRDTARHVAPEPLPS
jgi:universal stress protein A